MFCQNGAYTKTNNMKTLQCYEVVLILLAVENYRIACAPFAFSILQNSFHHKYVRQAHSKSMYEYAQYRSSKFQIIRR